MELLTGFAREHGITAARLHGIGAFTDAELGFYELDRKEYDRFLVDEETEVLAFLGNISMMDEGPRVHAHVTLGKRDGSAVGGHLFEGHVGAALELFVTESPEELRRELDEAVGLPLLDP
jgi:uncharacterized protein